jgi:hydrogenase maturation protease
MAASVGTEAGIRLLGLGNEILGDDAFGIRVAQEARRRFQDKLQVVCSSAAGFDLLDDLLGVARLLVVDTVVTGTCEPGTVGVFRADEFQSAPCGSPHFVGLFELLRVAKELDLPLPREMAVVAVEAAECSTVGGIMNPAVEAAIPRVLDLVEEFLRSDP